MLLQDLRIAVRTLLRRPTFAAVAVVTLAVGIGATTAVFSLVDAALLRPLPYPEAGRLYRVWQAFPDWQNDPASRAGWDRVEVSFPQYLAIARASPHIDSAAAFCLRTATISGGGDAAQARIAFAASTLLRTLGLHPQLGRDLTPVDETGANGNVAMISDHLWRRRFGGDPSVIGRTTNIDEQPYVIVGVMPPEMRLLANEGAPGGPQARPDVWVPVPLGTKTTTSGQGHVYATIVRLRKGADPRGAEAAIADLMRRTYATYGRQKGQAPIGRLEPLGRYETLASRAALWMLLSGAAIVLVVACGNVGNLMLSEIAPRSRELALRATLGAGRTRLVRMLLTESLVVAVAGGALGLGIAWWCVDALVAVAPPGTPNIDAVRLDYRVFLFSLGLTVGTGVLFGLLPAWFASRHDVAAGLREMQPTVGRAGGRAQRVVCVAQIALAATVLVSAALLAQSLLRLIRVDPGFRREGLLRFGVDLPYARYRTPEQIDRFYGELRARVEALPGVRAVTQASVVPFNVRPFNSNPVAIEGHAEQRIEAERRLVRANFFDVLGIRLLEGEPLRDTDTPFLDPAAAARRGWTPPPCRMVISRATARMLWPAGGAIGARVQSFGRDGQICTVVGIVADLKDRNLAAEPLPTFYVTTSGYDPVGGREVVLATDVAPEAIVPALRRIVARLDPEVPVIDPTTMEALVERSLAADRYRTIPLALFAIAAVLLSAVGTYGVMAQIVTRQTRALGIRLALGASPAQLMRMVLGHAALIAAAGLVVGVLAARAFSRLLGAFLFGIQPTDARTYVAVVCALAALTLAAGWIPARRATRLDPASVLRTE